MSYAGGGTMTYDYKEERPYVLTDEGQRRLIQTLDFAKRQLAIGGAVRADKLMIHSGDLWKTMALVDRLVEIGELVEVSGGIWKHRVFVGKYEAEQ